MRELNLEPMRPLLTELEQHPIYQALRAIEDLRLFMQHHVFLVWDFMSLLKYLQLQIAPARVPWTPEGDPALRYFINQLVVEEESDTAPGPRGEILFGSHFELYCNAMREIGGEAELAERFLDLVRKQGVDQALSSGLVPEPSREFLETTFGLLREDKPHLAAAGLALGRERIIPEMFRRFLREIQINEVQAPSFHYYLKRHIRLDEEVHGPLSLRLLAALCQGDPTKIEEAEAAAEEAICARIRFWDRVLETIATSRNERFRHPNR